MMLWYGTLSFLYQSKMILVSLAYFCKRVLNPYVMVVFDLKVWRLDTIVGMLYHGLPMSSTDTNIMVHTCAQELCVRPQHIRFRASSVALVIVLKALAQAGYSIIPPAHPPSAAPNANQREYPLVFTSHLRNLDVFFCIKYIVDTNHIFRFSISNLNPDPYWRAVSFNFHRGCLSLTPSLNLSQWFSSLHHLMNQVLNRPPRSLTHVCSCNLVNRMEDFLCNSEMLLFLAVSWAFKANSAFIA